MADVKFGNELHGLSFSHPPDTCEEIKKWFNNNAHDDYESLPIDQFHYYFIYIYQNLRQIIRFSEYISVIF